MPMFEELKHYLDLPSIIPIMNKVAGITFKIMPLVDYVITNRHNLTGVAIDSAKDYGARLIFGMQPRPFELAEN